MDLIWGCLPPPQNALPVRKIRLDPASPGFQTDLGKHRRPHSLQVPRDPEEPEGADRIGGKNQQEKIGQPCRSRRCQRRRARLDALETELAGCGGLFQPTEGDEYGI